MVRQAAIRAMHLVDPVAVVEVPVPDALVVVSGESVSVSAEHNVALRRVSPGQSTTQPRLHRPVRVTSRRGRGGAPGGGEQSTQGDELQHILCEWSCPFVNRGFFQFGITCSKS